MKSKLVVFVALIMLITSTFFMYACGTKYKVVYMVDGNAYYQCEVKEGKLLVDSKSQATAPKKEGYDFLGWYCNGQKWNFAFNTVNENILLEAKWRVDLNEMFDEYYGKAGITIASDGSYMEIDTNRFDWDDFHDSSVAQKVEEVNKKLGFSDSLYQRMLGTSSIQGRQTDENDIVKVSWTYHPDHGLEVLYEVK